MLVGLEGGEWCFMFLEGTFLCTGMISGGWSVYVLPCRHDFLEGMHRCQPPKNNFRDKKNCLLGREIPLQ